MKHKIFEDKPFIKRLSFAESCNIDIACWSELVMWSRGYVEFSDCFNQICRPPKLPYAYCGKCNKYFD